MNEEQKQPEKKNEPTINFTFGRNKEDKRPFKERAITWIIDNVILIMLIIVVIYAQIDGKFIRSETKLIDVCQGQPVRATINGKEVPITTLLTKTNITQNQTQIEINKG